MPNEAHSSTSVADLSWPQRLEFISTIFAAILGLTYVSGYLIVTTFLSRFGISADASELLKAKYIYVGFLYWLFVAIIGVLGRAVYLFFRAIRASESLSKEEQVKAIPILERELFDTGGLYHPWLPLRRWVVLSLVLVPFAVQIVFLDPNDVRAFVCWQSILLLSICLYQATFYREFRKDGYAWGSLYAEWYVKGIKLVCGVLPGLLAAFFMVGTALGPWAFSRHDNEVVDVTLRLIRPFYIGLGWIRRSWAFWIFGTILIVVHLFVALFVTLSTENLRWLENNGRARAFSGSFIRGFVLSLRDCVFLIAHAASVFLTGTNGEETKSVPSELKTAIDCIGLPVITGMYLMIALRVLHNDNSEFNARVLAFGTLILSLIAISNVIIILMMRRDLIVALKLNQESDPNTSLLGRSDVWFVRVLMVVILYIVSVLGFAYRVYPFVPVQKAGGDYSTADTVAVFVSPSPECSSGEFGKELQPPRPYVVLSEDSNWVYLAPVSGFGSGGGPKCWRWGPFCSSLSKKSVPVAEDPSRPSIYTLNRHCVVGTVTVDAVLNTKSN
jgi:hypothetical protein